MYKIQGPRFPLLVILLTLGMIEGVAYWWMHPAPAGLGEAVLVYRPESSDRGLDVVDGNDAPASSFHPSSPLPTRSRPGPAQTAPPSGTSPFRLRSASRHPGTSGSTHTLLPELVSQTISSLRCSTGTAARIDRNDGVTVHVAFFAWNLASSGNALEAFKHLPEQCLGSVGMTLLKVHPPRSYQVGDEILSFDHTEFRDPTGSPTHAFKGVWISGASSLLGSGIRGGGEQSRLIRLKAAFRRFRPAYARVAQGAIRGIADPDHAWKIFEESMLRDLGFESLNPNARS